MKCEMSVGDFCKVTNRVLCGDKEGSLLYEAGNTEIMFLRSPRSDGFVRIILGEKICFFWRLDFK